MIDIAKDGTYKEIGSKSVPPERDPKSKDAPPEAVRKTNVIIDLPPIGPGTIRKIVRITPMDGESTPALFSLPKSTSVLDVLLPYRFKTMVEMVDLGDDDSPLQEDRVQFFAMTGANALNPSGIGVNMMREVNVYTPESYEEEPEEGAKKPEPIPDPFPEPPTDKVEAEDEDDFVEPLPEDEGEEIEQGRGRD
jgi:hypothetical protein